MTKLLTGIKEPNFGITLNKMYKQYYLKELPFMILTLLVVSYGFSLLKLMDTPKVIEWPPRIDVVKAQEPSVTPIPAPKDIFESTFGSDADDMRAIAKAESGMVADKENIAEKDCSIGWFQINLAHDFCSGKKVHWNKVPGETLEEKKDWLKVPENNLIIAKFILATQGKNAWSAYSSGAYLKFLE